MFLGPSCFGNQPFEDWTVARDERKTNDYWRELWPILVGDGERGLNGLILDQIRQ